MRASAALAAAYALDLALGEPPNLIHPVAWMGVVIGRAKAWALRGTKRAQLARGATIALVLPSACAAAAFVILHSARRHPLLELALSVALLKPMFAARSLREAAFAVRDALEAGDLESARSALGSLCSRNADALDPEELVAATIESVAENTSDSVVAPLLFFAGAGVPGAVFYRCVNTLDAMVGYRGRLEYAGKASARLDDLLNLLPARVTALLLLAAGALTGGSGRNGVRVLRRDAGRTESPNAGWPMATMAGLLRVRLVKVDHYALGDAERPLTPTLITDAWRVASLASALAAGLVVLALGYLDA
jgi:adenosylcobinamide-phosphate synthase